MNERIKITVLGGFLGSGKTTLLNAMLRDTEDPLGVIVNDFGSINVDADLLGAHAAVEGEVALQNGCICCTIRSDLLAASLALARRPHPPRHIVIETSGVSDPAAVARTFLHPQIADLVELSTIAVCVDPLAFSQLAEAERDLAADQVRVADFVVLTKTDTANASEQAGTRDAIRAIARDVRVVDSAFDAMPTALMLNTPKAWARPVRPEVEPREVHVHAVDEHHGHAHHHGHAYETWTFRTPQPLSLYRLRRALRELPVAVFRAKGFVYVAQDRATRVFVQIAGRRAELAHAGPWGNREPRTELVLLGPEGTLHVPTLRKLLESCIDSGVESTDDFMDDMLGFFNRVLSGLPGHVG